MRKVRSSSGKVPREIWMEKQADGWPMGVEEPMKAAITAAVKQALEHAALPTWMVRSAVNCAVPAWRISPCLDWQQAVIERACRAAGAGPLWSLRDAIPVG